MHFQDVHIKPTRPSSEEAIQLSTMDQLMPRRHMSYLLCFRQAPSVSHKATVQQLQEGLAAALTEMPQFAGTIRPKSGSKNELELLLDPESYVLFRSCDATDAASYDELLDSMGREPLITDDRLAIPAAEMQTPDGGTRSFAVQATTVKGGLLIATSIHHSVGDAKATEVLFESWAKHTAERSHGQSPTITIPAEDVTARWRLSYGPKNVSMDSFLELHGPKDAFRTSEIAAQVVTSRWTISSQALQQLRDSMGSKADIQLSSSDLMCALIARHVYKARRQYETSNRWPDEALLYVTSDMRSRLEPSLAKNYLGNASVAVPALVDLVVLCDEEASTALSTTASKIKNAIDKFDTNALRSRLAFYKAQPFFGSVMPRFEYYPGPNMLITDSSSMRFYSINWGLNLRTMDYFKSIGQTHSVGQCALNPKRSDGTVELQMRHDVQVVEAMKDNEGFSKYFELVGYC